MDFLELAKKRYSVRKFKDQKIEKETLDKILEAGRVAPTGCNYQPQRIMVIDDPAALEKVKECTPYTFGAPVILMICYDISTCWKSATNGTIGGIDDACIAATQMMLEAEDLGLGSTWVGGFNAAKLRELFDIPDYLVPHALLPIGHPADDAQPSHLHEKRYPVEHFVFYNSFDGLEEGKPHIAKAFGSGLQKESDIK